MSVNLDAVPESSPPAAIEVGGPLAQVWRNIFPWDDLNAKSPPERYLSLGQEILPSLGVLAAQGPDRPRLLQTDLLARLLTVGSLNAVDKATAQKAIGSGVIQVNNPNLFAPGSFVAVQPAAGGATLANSQFYQVLGPTANPGELSIAPVLTAQVNPGDFIVSVPAVWIAGQSLNVQVGNSINVATLPAIQIAAAQQVNIGNTVTVAGTINIGNTPAVTIASGQVTIGGTPNINIQSQSVTVNVNQLQTSLANLNFPANVRSTQTTAVVPAGTHSLALENSGVANLNNVVVKGHTTGVQYWPLPFTFDVFPVNPTFNLTQTENVVIPVDSTQDTQFDVTATNVSAVNAVAIRVTAILDTQSVYVQNNPGAPVYIAGLHGFNPGALYAVEALPPPYDISGTSAPASGSQATVTLAASASGKHYTTHTLSASSGQTGATAQQADISLSDGVAVLMTLTLYMIAGVGNNVLFSETQLAYPGSNNTSATFKFGAGTTGVGQRVNIGAYLS